MSQRIERRGAASLLGLRGAAPAAPRDGTTLLHLMHDGFYVLYMLRHSSAPPSTEGFVEKIRRFLIDFERDARRAGAEHEDIEAAKYAFCATVDEFLLASLIAMRKDHDRRPLQTTVFGDLRAGEAYFDRLDELRAKGAVRLEALQVFHMCLLIGFHGSYSRNGHMDKLHYVTARLGEELAHIKGKSRGFAPRAERPDQVVNKRHNHLPLWTLSGLFALIAVSAYVGMRSSLTHATMNGMAQYADLIKLAPRPANLTIILP